MSCVDEWKAPDKPFDIPKWAVWEAGDHGSSPTGSGPPTHRQAFDVSLPRARKRLAEVVDVSWGSGEANNPRLERCPSTQSYTVIPRSWGRR